VIFTYTESDKGSYMCSHVRISLPPKRNNLCSALYIYIYIN